MIEQAMITLRKWQFLIAYMVSARTKIYSGLYLISHLGPFGIVSSQIFPEFLRNFPGNNTF